MKAISLLFLFLFLIFNTHQSPKIEVKHEIESVTVYLNNAAITRTAHITIPVGKSELIFKGVSSKILDQGTSVSITNNVKVYSVSIEKNDADYTKNKEWLLLENKIELMNADKESIHIELISLKKEMEFLESNMRMGGNSTATLSQLDTRATYLRKNIKNVQKNISIEKKKLMSIHKKSDSLSVAQKKVENTIHNTATTIHVTVINKQATTCNIQLKYLVSNAIWKPFYSLRANDKNDSIRLEYQAQIYNDTGNIWLNKPITLAIMDSSADVGKPIMNPWVLSNDYDDYDLSSNEGKLSDAKGDYKKGENTIAYDIIQIDNLSTRFKLADLQTIPSDATPHLIDVKTYTKNVAYYSLSIPKIKDGAFLIAKIPNWERMNLLEGTMNLYYNDTFQGVSKLNTKQVSDVLEVSLGRDNAYTVTRRKISSKHIEYRIGFNIKEVVNYEILVKNKKNKAVEIEIRDQLPIAADKNVEVKPLELSNAQLEELSGQLTWHLKLNPNETKKILLSYSVKYPKNKRGIFRHNRKNLKSPRFF